MTKTPKKDKPYASFKDGWYDRDGHWEGSEYYDVTRAEWDQAHELKAEYMKKLDRLLAHRMKP